MRYTVLALTLVSMARFVLASSLMVNWGRYCYCEYCRRLCRDWYGLDLTGDPPDARPLLDHLAASCCTDFMLRLRQMLLARRPEMWLSANGSGGANADGDWRIGRDWGTWARRGYIDFYVPA